MPLYYRCQTRARLLACEDPNQPDVQFKSEYDRQNLIQEDARQIYAEEVTEDNPWTDYEGNPVPVGDFAITRSDGCVFRSKRDFFIETYAPYADLNQPPSNEDRADIPA